MHQIGIDVNLERKKINHIFNATKTRFRRCISIKKVSIEKIGSSDVNDREYGFKHLLRIINIQTKSYPRYAENLKIVLRQLTSLNGRIASLESLEHTFLSKASFNHSKKKLLEQILKLEKNFVAIKQKINFLIIHVNNQHRLFENKGVNLSGNEEAWLKRSIELEEEESESLINELKDCIGTSFKLLKGIALFQARFLNFLKRSVKHKFSNVIDDAQTVCDKVEQYTSSFYALKSYIQAAGFAAGFFAPDETIRTIGWTIAGGVFGIDYLMDWVAGLPVTRRLGRKLIAKINGTIDEEERKQQQLKSEFTLMAKRNMDVAGI